MLRRTHVEVLSFSLLYGIVLVYCQITEYHYVNLIKNWEEAQEYCRYYYNDLATMENIQDINRLPIPSDVTTWAWIGLRDDPASWIRQMTTDSNSWTWSATGTTSPGGYQSWAGAEPENTGGSKWCVTVDVWGWRDRSCAYAYSFICYNVQSSGTKEYFLISELKNWNNAQTYCRQNYHDLAMIETPSENQAVMDLVSNPSTTAWIGLSRVPYKWSDGNPSTYRRWRSGEPSGDGYCICQLNYEWNDIPCSLKRTFVCQGALKQVRVLTKIKLETTADMNDPAIKGTFLKLLGDHFEARASGVFLNSIIPLETGEENNNLVCVP